MEVTKVDLEKLTALSTMLAECKLEAPLQRYVDHGAVLIHFVQFLERLKAAVALKDVEKEQAKPRGVIPAKTESK